MRLDDVLDKLAYIRDTPIALAPFELCFVSELRRKVDSMSATEIQEERRALNAAESRFLDSIHQRCVAIRELDVVIKEIEMSETEKAEKDRRERIRYRAAVLEHLEKLEKHKTPMSIILFSPAENWRYELSLGATAPAPDRVLLEDLARKINAALQEYREKLDVAMTS